MEHLLQEFREEFDWENAVLLIRDATFFSASLHLTAVFAILLFTGKPVTIREPNTLVLFVEFWIMLAALVFSVHLAWKDIQK